jgi:LmbE family N-acetylglucosaminyl deacetylase
MNPYSDNSFFHQNYANLKVLVFVPHQDDEINATGALLYILAHCKAQITLVYTTNGDWEIPAEVRFKEAINAATILGVTENNIYFMGYGDTLNSKDKIHVFYHKNTVARSPAGHTETYGTDTHPDFAFLHEKQHHSYTSENYLKDLLSIIRKTEADIIIGTDFDCHADHRMLSLCLDRAVGIIRKENPSYKPEIWKRFAYPLAFNAVADYSSVNNPETKHPVIGITKNYKFDIIDFFYFIWKDRVRTPVPKITQTDRISDNILCKALAQHKSQRIVTSATQIINSDEVFWSRRTDCISHTAELSVSSGNGMYLNDFMVYNVANIDIYVPEYTDYCWRPKNEDPDKTAVFTWKEPVSIEKIVLYSAVSAESKINLLQVKLSNGFSKTIKNLPQNGNPVEIVFGKQENITSCTLKILSVTGKSYGIGECEIYSSKEFTSPIHPFCKILIEDNFAYEYFVNKKNKTIPLTVYTYGNAGNNSLMVENGKSVIRNGKLFIDESDQEIFIKAQNENGFVWDKMVVKRLSGFDLTLKKLSDMVFRLNLKKMNKQLKMDLEQ